MLPSLFFILSSLFLCFICSFSLFFFSPHPFLLLSLFKMLPSLFFILSSLFLCFICSFSLFTSPLTRFCSRHFLLLPLLFCHTAYLFSPTLVFFSCSCSENSPVFDTCCCVQGIRKFAADAIVLEGILREELKQ